MIKQWWGLVFKDFHIELKEFNSGDFAKMKLSYKDETNIDFVIEPFPAECFEDAKIIVAQALESSVEETDRLIKKFQSNAKKNLDRTNKKV